MPTTSHRDAIKIFNQQALATPLLLAFVDIFGLAPLAGTDDERWDPQTIEMEMSDVSGGVQPQSLDKLLVATEVLSSDTFETSLPDFIRICNVLADSPTDGSFDPAEVREICWAVIEAGLLLERRPKFNREIVGYIEKALQAEGFTELPSPLDVILPDPRIGWAHSNPNTDDHELSAMTQTVRNDRNQELQQYLGQRLRRMIMEITQLSLTAIQENWTQNTLQSLKALLSHGDQSSTSEMDKGGR